MPKIREVVIFLTCCCTAVAQSQNSKDPCAGQRAEVAKIQQWVSYDRSAKTPNLTTNLAKLASANELLKKCENESHPWNDGEFEAMLAKDADGLKKNPELPILTRVHTLNLKPPYFTGAVPLSYESEDAANGAIPLVEISPLGHLIRYVYGNLDTANYVLPSGAQATDKNSGRILAEARLIDAHLGSRTPYEVMEVHYNLGGGVVFRSRSSFSKEFGHFKIGESDVTGKKEREFFLWWPSGD